MRLIFIIFTIFISGSNNQFFSQTYKNGDLIFIKNKETKGKSLLPNGKSDFNYVGIVFIENEIPMVYYSTEPLSKCSLTEFINLSENKNFERKHLVEKELLTNDVIESMRNYAIAKLGSPYDNSLKLNNGELYNAEFVWKIYQNGIGLPLCIPREIRDYKLDPATIEFLTDAYGVDILNEKIVSIGDIYQSQFLD